MPRNERCVLPGQAYHITQRGTNRQRVFFTSSDRSAYLRLLGQNLAEAEVRLLAWCLMTNHVHLVVAPERADSLSILLRRVHGRYAQMVNARKLRSGHLWQNRFYSCALSPSHLWRALAYVERNPVRAGIAGRAEDYPWSSAAAHLGLARDRYGLLDMDFWREQGGAEGWSELLAAPEQALEVRLLRRCTYAGRPFGEEEFVTLFEERFGRVWRKWGFEGGERRVEGSIEMRRSTKEAEPTATLAKFVNCSIQADPFPPSRPFPLPLPPFPLRLSLQNMASRFSSISVRENHGAEDLSGTTGGLAK